MSLISFIELFEILFQYIRLVYFNKDKKPNDYNIDKARE